MSYILDALRKSEQQRRDDHQAAGAEPAPRWGQAAATAADRRAVYILLAIAVLVAAALIWNLLSLTTEDVSDAADLFTPQPPVGAAGLTPEPAAVAQAPVVEQRVDVPPPPAVVAAPAEQPPVSPSAEAGLAEVPKRALPPMAALRRIPQLMINSHIYSPAADKRSVVMNNREWREGDVIADGVVLQEITADGIMLDVEGWPVHVGRSKGWQAIPGSD
ncbi:MAG: general secretion pathway protein GspB [Pseudomonadota bacterium]|nr:general secretion pathway protein GspB [Pseudomonadota bacterium]